MIVSCQAVDDEPLNDSLVIAKMAYACQVGGAQVLRLSQAEHIKEVKKLINVPIIGLIKQHYLDSEVYITPTIAEVRNLVALNVDIIALDATLRIRAGGQTLGQLFGKIKAEFPKQLLMADCSTILEMQNAQELGFDFVSTTLRGYTNATINQNNIEKDYEFIKAAQKVIKIPLIVEGGIWDPQTAKEILQLGVHAIVVGGAITRPQLIVKHWLEKIFAEKKEDA
ncbi:N-acetylmannosamine-6-phosphate 2-epimerase [Spiroplasma clarkii]|uniref:N-acetylmannosamine-6-phosphate 2-epimerase n=1 Tax=Spiroplasma clarkii TaxID=2139 RepID=UPI001C99191A